MSQDEPAVSGTGSLVAPAGIFDGFEGYLTPRSKDYKALLTTGMVVLDANVLLNLYRYTADARDDLFTVLERISDRLWIPHQVMTEFWRNRESVLRDPRDAKKTIAELAEVQERAVRAVQTWASRVSLDAAKSGELRGCLTSAFDRVTASIDEHGDPAGEKVARDTNLDEVIGRLSSLLAGRVGPQLPPEDQKVAVIEGLRRVSERVPPGYMDKKKDDDGAAGDYLVWEQVLLEASSRSCDVLLVTADVKEDWWRIEAGERRGPRVELVRELRDRSSTRLFMMRPPTLLDVAGSLLKITVRETSVADASRVDELLTRTGTSPDGGWDIDALYLLLDRLDAEAPVQADVLRAAGKQSGFVTRDQVYRIGEYAEDRSLRGFTRPLNRLTQEFRNRGVITDDAVDPFWAVYNDDSQAFGWAAGYRVHGDVLPLLQAVMEGDAEVER